MWYRLQCCVLVSSEDRGDSVVLAAMLCFGEFRRQRDGECGIGGSAVVRTLESVCKWAYSFITSRFVLPVHAEPKTGTVG